MRRRRTRFRRRGSVGRRRTRRRARGARRGGPVRIGFRM